MPTAHDTDVTDRHEERLLLWLARRVGVLEALTSTAGTAAALARETGLAEPIAARFLRILTDFGFVRRVGDEFEVTNRALGFLATRDVRSIGVLPRELDVVDAAVEFATAHDGRRDGSRASTQTDSGGDCGTHPGGTHLPTERDDETWLRHRLGAHAATPTATVRACVTAAVHAAPSAGRVVDCYGASGVYAAEFADRGLETTFVDAPGVVETVGPLLASREVSTLEADPDAGALPVEDAHLAFAASVLSRHDPATGREVLAAMRAAVVPGGTVVVVEPARESPSGRRTAVERLCLGSGDVYDTEALTEWAADVGLVDVDSRAVPGTDYRVVFGHRPGERAVDNGPDRRR